MVKSRTIYFSFTETKVFTRQFDRLTTVETLYALQDDLIENPHKGDVIKGTGGARKGRIGDPKQNRGKRGAYRYIYVYLEHGERIYLLLFYGKNEQDNLTQEQTRELAALVRQLKEIFGEAGDLPAGKEKTK